jgi:hypothetical protein
MPIFLERFVLTILAAVATGVCLLNPFKFDTSQRVSLFLAIAFFAYFVAHTANRAKVATPVPPPPQQNVPTTSNGNGPATANGSGSVANSGNGNTITSNGSPQKEEQKTAK